MQVDVRQRGSIEVIDIRGEAEPRNGEGILRERLAPLMDAGECLFILNITRGPVLDSGFLGELVACRERVRKRHGVIKLVLTRGQRDLIVASRLDALFETFQDEDDALDSFLAENTTAGIP